MFSKLRNKELTKLKDDQIERAGEIFNKLIKIKGVGVAIAAKTLHILIPDVFVPTDNPILKKLKIKKSEKRYIDFLKNAKEEAKNIIEDFKKKRLKGDPKGYLSRKLCYKRYRTLAKYIDEYYWVTKTNL